MKRSAAAVFDPFNVSVPTTDTVEFYEPAAPSEPIVVESTIYPKKEDNPIKYNDYENIPDVLRWLRYRVKLLLDPLYVFVGMIESGLGGTSTAYQYAWKTGVHSAKQIQNMAQIYTRHQHLDKHWIDDAFILHLYAESGTVGAGAGKVKQEGIKKTKKEEKEEEEAPEDSGEESIEYSMSQIRARLIGANCAPYQGEINVISADNLYKLFETVMGNVTMGVIEMCAAELNDSIGRDFTPIELILSPSVRGMFARFVASKIEAGRESAPPQGHGHGGRYILAPSYKQKTAMSKWGIGLKLWFKNVYRQENAQYRKDLERVARQQEELANMVADANNDSVVLRQIIIDIIQAVSSALLPCLLVHHNKPAF